MTNDNIDQMITEVTDAMCAEAATVTKIKVTHIPKNTKFLIDKHGIFGWTSTTLSIW